MSSPEHRAGEGTHVGPKLLLAVAFLIGTLVGAAVVGLVAAGTGGSAADPSGVADPAAPSPSPAQIETPTGTTSPTAGRSAGEASPSPSPTTPPTASASSSQPAEQSQASEEQQAQMTKPLADLQRGDRVVYNMNVCRFRQWVSDTSVALINCPGGPPFQARVELLVPVEPGD